jgi:hypothetical protein
VQNDQRGASRGCCERAGEPCCWPATLFLAGAGDVKGEGRVGESSPLSLSAPGSAPELQVERGGRRPAWGRRCQLGLLAEEEASGFWPTRKVTAHSTRLATATLRQRTDGYS